MIFKAIMRYFSYLFHALLALILMAIAGVGMGAGEGGSLRMGMLPWWTGQTLEYVLFFGALAGLAITLLAVKGILRILFLIWSFLIFALLVKGYFISMYVFRPNEFRIAVYLLIGSVLALVGAWFQLRTSARPRKY